MGSSHGKIIPKAFAPAVDIVGYQHKLRDHPVSREFPTLRRCKFSMVGPSTANKHVKTTGMILVIGASTGGTEAIKEVLVKLPADTPGTVITQQIPAAFSASFAKRLDGLCAMTVTEAVDGVQIVRGHAFLAPGGRHLLVEPDGAPSLRHFRPFGSEAVA